MQVYTKRRVVLMKILILIFAGICLIIFCLWQNNSIVITRWEYASSKIPGQFDGYVIAHISDLHNKEFGKNQSTLLNKLEDTHPDIIVVTGDLIDRRRFNLNVAMRFINGAVQIAPVYFVSGNHEAWSNKYPGLRESLVNAGVRTLDNSMAELSAGEGTISVLGLQDPDFLTSSYMEGTDTSRLTEQLEQWSSREEFQILLAHRPELFKLYAANNINLVFSGHAHGGQFRLPFIGGLVAPDQGLFPKYTSGYYKQDESTMFVSRGLGNSIVPIRIFNRPEIVVVTLTATNKN